MDILMHLNPVPPLSTFVNILPSHLKLLHADILYGWRVDVCGGWRGLWDTAAVISLLVTNQLDRW